MKSKEKLILRFLKEQGRSSTTKIAAAINSDIWRARKYLDELKKQKKIDCKEETNATYWCLTEEDLK
jgi:predicted transcriptional regulator